MERNYDKIEAPTETTDILGGRTLKQIISIMDKLEGILEIVDIPNSEDRRRSVFSHSSYFRRNPSTSQWSMQHLCCYDDLSFDGHQSRPKGSSVWDMYIAHHFKPYTKNIEPSPQITHKNLGKFIKEGQIAYVIAPRCDVRKDLDSLENFIAKCDQRLATIGEWVSLDLCMLVQCACGRRSYLNARDRFHMVSESRATLDVVRKLRCTDCGASDIKSTTAYYREGKSAFRKYLKVTSFRSSSGSRKPLDNLYINVGGDGENSAYLGDGLYVDADGTLHG